MSDRYDVDDILNEIKQKKSQRQELAAKRDPAEAVTRQAAAPKETLTSRGTLPPAMPEGRFSVKPEGESSRSVTYTDAHRSQPMASRQIRIDDTLQDYFRPAVQNGAKSAKHAEPEAKNAAAVSPPESGAVTPEGRFRIREEEPVRTDAEPQIFAEPQRLEDEIDRQATRPISIYDEFKRARDLKIDEFQRQEQFDGLHDDDMKIAGEPAISAADNARIAKELTDAAVFEARPEQDEDDVEIDEFERPEQAESIRVDLQAQKQSLVARCIATGFLTVLLLYLALSATAGLPVPEAISFSGSRFTFLIVNIVLICAAVLINNVPVGGGIIALFKMKADSDSLVACAVIAAVVQGVAMLMAPEVQEIGPQTMYFSVAVFALWLNSAGKITMISRIIDNFDVITSRKTRYVLAQVEDRGVAKALAGGREIGSDSVRSVTEAGFLTRYLELSYSEDFADGVNRVVAPILLVCSVVVAAATYFFTKDIFAVFSALAAVLCAAAPFTSTLATGLPVRRACKAVASSGNAMISGYRAAERLAATDAVILDAADIFFGDNIILHGIKTFSKGRIDEAILDAASVVCSIESTLGGIFEKVIGGNKKMLKPVDSLVYEDGMGLSAWVDSKRVLIGNRMLMANHGIDLPAEEYEMKYLRDGKNVLYLSNSGDLTAMFILGYKAGDDAAYALENLAAHKIGLIVHSTDPNVTPEMLAERFDFPAEQINVLSSKLHPDYARVSARRDRADALACCGKNARSVAEVLHAAFDIKKRVSAAVMLQIAASILGSALVTFFAFTGNLPKFGFLALTLFQLFWAVAVWLLSAVGNSGHSDGSK